MYYAAPSDANGQGRTFEAAGGNTPAQPSTRFSRCAVCLVVPLRTTMQLWCVGCGLVVSRATVDAARPVSELRGVGSTTRTVS
jgi:hypothetical protein